MRQLLKTWLATVPGPFGTMMGCLACGEPSDQAWRILAEGADFCLTITDDASAVTMRRLAEARGGGPAIVAGESGAAGLAGFLGAAGKDASRTALRLGRESRVLVIGTEGATDPGAYRRITGLSPEQVDSGLG